ncbi:hypothetical protein [Streptomyces sp. NPDC005969]|uniref:hypothetical protein n=1 Tax=Streptomyces sp. NPDC005969 TaxID=3156722 RepID=UPI0033FF9647
MTTEHCGAAGPYTEYATAGAHGWITLGNPGCPARLTKELRVKLWSTPLYARCCGMRSPRAYSAST